MKKRASFRIYGDLPQLDRVPRFIRVVAMPQIVDEGVEIARDEAPKMRGASSKKSIVTRIRGSTEKEFAIGHVKAGAPHSHLIEFGTKRHALAPGSGKRKWRKGKNPNRVVNIPGTGYRRAPLMGPAFFPLHPGSRANPFMRRTEQRLPRVAERVLAKVGADALEDSIRRGVDLI